MPEPQGREQSKLTAPEFRKLTPGPPQPLLRLISHFHPQPNAKQLLKFQGFPRSLTRLLYHFPQTVKIFHTMCPHYQAQYNCSLKYWKSAVTLPIIWDLMKSNSILATVLAG